MRSVCRFQYSVFIIIFVNTDYRTKYRLMCVRRTTLEDIFISKQMFDLIFFIFRWVVFAEIFDTFNVRWIEIGIVKWFG